VAEGFAVAGGPRAAADAFEARLIESSPLLLVNRKEASDRRVPEVGSSALSVVSYV
jgi:hypothetical protein